MKRLVPLFLALVLLFLSGSASTATVMYTDRDVSVLQGQEAVVNVFGNGARSAQNLQIEKIQYSYTFDLSEESEACANVAMQLRIFVSGRSYPISASGNVMAETLPDGDTLWSGPLYGSVTINGVTYDATAGFMMLASTSAMQGSLNLQAPSEISTLALTFGDHVLTQEMVEGMMAANAAINALEANSNLTVTADEIAATSTGNYQFIGTSIRTLTGGYSNLGTGQIARSYFNQKRNTFALAIQTFESTPNAHFAEYANVSGCYTRVYKLGYGLTLTTNEAEDNHAWIAGYEKLPFTNGSTSSLGVLIKAVFEDILSVLGVPTSTINAILNGVKGDFVLNQSLTQNSEIEIRFGLLTTANFESSEVGIPIVYQLTRNQNGYESASQITIATDVTYLTMATQTNNQYPVYYYTRAGTTNRTFNISLG